jgi:hypothetical protein
MTATANDFAILVRTYLRPGVLCTTPDGSDIVFNPPLTVAEQAIFADLQLMNKFGVDMTLAEWQSIKPDAAGLKAYLGLSAPTLAQTAAATKAIIRVLATIVRD